MPELRRFARRHGIKILTTNDIIRHRLKTERLVKRVAETALPTSAGEMTIIAYQTRYAPEEEVAVVKGASSLESGRPKASSRSDPNLKFQV